MSALEAMQEKNIMLENSLSAETKLKLDLFSALGDVKRQLALSNGMYFIAVESGHCNLYTYFPISHIFCSQIQIELLLTFCRLEGLYIICDTTRI